MLSGNAFDNLLGLRVRSVHLLNALGDSTGFSVQVAEPLVGDFERILGVDHPDSIKSRSTLAMAYQTTGRTGEAITLFEEPSRIASGYWVSVIQTQYHRGPLSPGHTGLRPDQRARFLRIREACSVKSMARVPSVRPC
jgi:hypothetical protein